MFGVFLDNNNKLLTVVVVSVTESVRYSATILQLVVHTMIEKKLARWEIPVKVTSLPNHTTAISHLKAILDYR